MQIYVVIVLGISEMKITITKAALKQFASQEWYLLYAFQ